MRRFLFIVACAIVALIWSKSGSNPEVAVPRTDETPALLSPSQERVKLPEPRVSEIPPTQTAAPTPKVEPKTVESVKARLEEALRKDPENSELLAEMGFLYLEGLKQPRKAIEFFERSLSADASNPEVVSAAGSIYLNERLFKRGTEFLAQLREKNPNNTTISVAMADMLAKQGRPSEGMEALEEAGRRTDNPAGFAPYLGMMYLNNGKTAQAVEVFKKQLETRETAPGIDPMVVEMARLDLANAVLAHGDTNEAERIVRGVLDRNPDEPNAKELWARVRKSGESPPPEGSPKTATF